MEAGLLVKFECDGAGGSHKGRAARYIVRAAIQTGRIVPGQTTIIEKTGGNFGLGLLAACHRQNIAVELAIGLGFNRAKKTCLQNAGAKLIGLDMLNAGATPRTVVEWHLDHAASLGKSYFYTDQFSNPGCVTVHEQETGPEIVAQLRQWPSLDTIVLVACAGTGASLTGIARCLKAAGYRLETTLVEPDGCDGRTGLFVDHALEGMSVGVVPPLLDWNLVDRVATVDLGTMRAAQNRFAAEHGYLVGNTSAACLAVAARIIGTTTGRRKVLTLVYDHGAWYCGG